MVSHDVIYAFFGKKYHPSIQYPIQHLTWYLIWPPREEFLLRASFWSFLLHSNLTNLSRKNFTLSKSSPTVDYMARAGCKCWWQVIANKAWFSRLQKIHSCVRAFNIKVIIQYKRQSCQGKSLFAHYWLIFLKQMPFVLSSGAWLNVYTQVWKISVGPKR